MSSKTNPTDLHYIRTTTILTQPAITCSKLAIETLEQCVKYVQRYSSLLTLNIFNTLLYCFYC